MKAKHLICVFYLLAILFSGCDTKKNVNEGNSDGEKQKTNVNSYQHVLKGNGMAAMSVIELSAITEKLNNQLREDYRWWCYDEPERWPYLGDKFAEEVIKACPDAVCNQEQISIIYETYLKKRAQVRNSASKNKQQEAGYASSEFIYDLTILLGGDNYGKWRSFADKNLQAYTNKRDSLKLAMEYRNGKINQHKH